jgi:hypothetical protein
MATYTTNIAYTFPHQHVLLYFTLYIRHPLTGHLGHFRTKVIVERDFWWPGLSTFVNE